MSHDATHGECAYLCFAWGESDLPVAVVAPTRSAVLQFFVDEWFGEQPEKMGSDNRAEWDAAVIHFDTHDWREEGPLKWTFEIGGIEITKVSAVSETAPLVAGDLKTQREIHDTYAPVSATLENDAKDADRYRFVCAHNPPGLRLALTDIRNCKEDIDGIVDAAMKDSK